ncbi:MAG: DUF1501 domain-containing protein [Verrucomicrobiota bacterium]
MNETSDIASAFSRRGFFQSASGGVYGAALASLLGPELLGEKIPHGPAAAGHNGAMNLKPKRPHYPARAKAVIHLCMQGGPSQVDTFDPKPMLEKHHGEAVPDSITKGTFQVRTSKLLRSQWKFAKYGKSGLDVSELLPHIAQEADELAVIRSMYNVHPNHEPAIYKMQTGQIFPSHPTFGSWITYGLGSHNQNLPAYVVLADPGGKLPVNNVENWMSGYLPPLYGGTPMRGEGSPMLNLRPQYEEPVGVTNEKRGLLAKLDRMHQQQRPFEPRLDTRIENYELAARMQLTATEALDVTQETEATRESYGIGQKETDSYGKRCLLARRLVERGVRFVQLYTRGQMWDNHGSIATSLPNACKSTDQPVAALLRDLRQRGLLDSTLVIWGGEFGRLPMAQGDNEKKVGRDHGPWGFTTWMAGGGVKAGTVYGSTDEFGFASVENRVSIQDWHATILRLLGLDFDRLHFARNGLEEKLTHVFDTRVVKEIIA